MITRKNGTFLVSNPILWAVHYMQTNIQANVFASCSSSYLASFPDFKASFLRRYLTSFILEIPVKPKRFWHYKHRYALLAGSSWRHRAGSWNGWSLKSMLTVSEGWFIYNSWNTLETRDLPSEAKLWRNQ